MSKREVEGRLKNLRAQAATPADPVAKTHYDRGELPARARVKAAISVEGPRPQTQELAAELQAEISAVRAELVNKLEEAGAGLQGQMNGLQARMNEVRQELRSKTEDTARGLQTQLNKMQAQLNGLQAQTDQVKQELTAKIADMQKGLADRVTQVRQELTGRMADTEARLQAQINQLRARS